MLKKCLPLLFVPIVILLMGCNATTQVPVYKSLGDSNYINGLYLQGGTLWAATENGALAWDTSAGTCRSYTTADGLAGNSVRNITAGKDGRLWFAAGGVSSFDGTSWQSWHLPEYVTAIAADNNGCILAGCQKGSVYRYDGGKWQNILPPQAASTIPVPENVTPHGNIDYPETTINSIASDNRGNIFIIMDTDRLFCYDGRQLQEITAINGESLAGAGYLAARSGEIRLWAAVAGGQKRLFVYNSESWTSANAAWFPGAVLNVNNDGNRWLICKDGEIVLHDVSSGTKSATPLAAGNACTATVTDAAGNVWCGTTCGIFRYDGAEWQQYVANDD